MMRWGLFLVLAAGFTAYAFWVYRRAELPVPGRGRLALLRSAVLVLVLLLVFDPVIPVTEAPGARARWALLDASASMGAGDRQAWTDALTRARDLQGDGWTVVAFGDGDVRVVSPDSLGAPTAPRTRLAPALERAAEAGVADVRVVSDLRLHDRLEVDAILSTMRARVTFEPVGRAIPDVALTALDVRGPVRPGEPMRATVRIATRSAAGDSVTVEIREEGRLVAARTVASPASGLGRTVEFELRPPADTGRVRYSARVLAADDGFPDDDGRVAYVNVDRPEGGVVLVSLRPDWEARFLLPVLGRVTGLETRGYLRVSGDRYLPVGSAGERGAPLSASELRAAVPEAGILVVQGAETPPAWLAGALAAAPRVLVLASGPGMAAAAGVSARAPAPGEWYVAPEVSASPLAGEIQGIGAQGLPPLGNLLPLSGEPAGAVPLRLQLRGSGPAQAALILEETARGRRAVALSAGFWRWASRSGEGREAYRRLWSGVAGWLLDDGDRPVGAEVRPREWVAAAAQPVSWQTGAGRLGPVTLRVLRADTTVLDTVLTPAPGVTTVTTPELPPGTYAFTALDEAGGAIGSGRFDVSGYVDEMAPVVDPAGGMSELAGGGPGAAGRRRLPLRTSPWPYLVLLVLLSAEWVVRRRIGLR